MNTKNLVNWVVRLALLSIAIVGLFIAHAQVRALRVERASAIAELEKTPDKLLEAAAQQSDLEKHEFDIQRIRSYLITRSDVVDVVSRIEQEGQQEGLDIQVPAIEEVIEAASPEAASGGPTTEIEIDVSVDGSPESIMRFAHRVEHLPYMLWLDYMVVGNTRQTASRGTTGITPDQDRGGSEGVQPNAHGEFTFILSVQKES